MIGPFKKA
jgi:transposase InsO family protein